VALSEEIRSLKLPLSLLYVPVRRMSHHPSCGFSTRETRLEWYEAHDTPVPPGGEKTTYDPFNNSMSNSGVLSVDTLTADPDTTKPLYYWQLYSLLGWEYIEEIVTKFYERVYDDDEDPHFRKAFTQLADLQHHIETQSAYWQDAFGGGKVYHGSHGRLNFHHERNAYQVMNAEGATRWMMHMGMALHDMFPVLKAVDPRIPATIIDFLETKMKKYVLCSMFFLPFLVCDVSVSLLSIYCCLPVFSDTT
jgi:truncated hemoglobin YjbI